MSDKAFALIGWWLALLFFGLWRADMFAPSYRPWANLIVLVVSIAWGFWMFSRIKAAKNGTISDE